MKIHSQMSSEKPLGKADIDSVEIPQVDWKDALSAACNVGDSDCKIPLSFGEDSEEDVSDCEGCDSSSSSPCPERDPDDPDDSELSPEKTWSELTCPGRTSRVLLRYIGRPLAVVALLYCFICSLDLLSSAFRLLGGKAAGEAFSSSVLLQNPVAGLMIGILATVLVQSSSTSTSIVVTMVASGIMTVRPAIPIIMGANIGTSVTNTIVSLAQSSDRGQFELAFGGATVHDMFNWLAVLVFLPLEVVSGYLYYMTGAIVQSINLESTHMKKQDFLKALTKPFTSLVVQLDKKVIEKIAMGHEEYLNKSLLKDWCGYETVLVPVNATVLNNTTLEEFGNETLYEVLKKPVEQCWYIFHDTGLSDTLTGLILLAISLCALCTCLVLIVKVLNSALKGRLDDASRRVLNKELPGKCGYFTGYLALLAGAGMTILVQSSSVFTSTLTPLVGMGVISLERMYPLTLGSNIGTTTTGLLAAMAASGDKLKPALQIALVHLFFNISGILLFYPVPFMRWPIRMARMMGATTASYRWFAILYLVLMFFILPGSLFALSMAGTTIFFTVISVIGAFIIFVAILNVLKKKYHSKLSVCGKRFVDSFPRCFYSLAPLDDKIQWVANKIKAACGWMKRTCCPCCDARYCGCCCCCKEKSSKPKPCPRAGQSFTDSTIPMLLGDSRNSTVCGFINSRNTTVCSFIDAGDASKDNFTDGSEKSLKSKDSSIAADEGIDLGVVGKQSDEELADQVISIFQGCTSIPIPSPFTGDSAYASKDNSPNMSKYPSTERVSNV